MMKQFVNNAYKFKGKYVATKSFKDNNVIVFGDNAGDVINKARKITKNPVLIYVSDNDVINIPSCWRIKK